MRHSNSISILLCFAAIWELSFADIYMHNPRGSNDRNCERNVNRNNGNRLFDSQNNNNGGYACPRGVGDESFQAENGDATFYAVNPMTGDTTSFTQNKRMYYYSGSVLPIEWTNQHGCGGNSKVSCEIIIQYACEDTLDPRVDNFWPWVQNKAENTSTYYGKQHFRSANNIAAPRDGVPIDVNDAATDTINDNEANAIPNTAANRRYGMQESYDYYQLCQRTERNKGLYTADQLINRNDRRGTRQNPNGNRHGFECPEERDYYPWWAPSPWIDVAVLSDSASETVCYSKNVSSCSPRCQYYMNNTMNAHKKGYCDVNHHNSTVSKKLNHRMWQQNQWYNNQAACQKNGFHWYEISHADNLVFDSNNAFVCARTQFSRVNQLGNAFSDTIVSQSAPSSAGVVQSHVSENLNANRFLWTIPTIPTATAGTKYFTPNMESAYKSCVLRIRYNISSADFQQWPIEAVIPGTPKMVDSHNNSRYNGDPRTPLHQDPYVYIGPGDTATKGQMFVKLKVNTNQYGRTFQDRSYVFSIKPLPTTSAAATDAQDTPTINYQAMQTAIQNGGKIYNVNVRGKRGNIVEVYPSVEYDFVPNALALSTNDMIHFQWTGSDYNPRRGCNDGMGGPPDLNTYSTSANADQNPRADRSNVVLTYHMGYNVPMDYIGYNPSNKNISYAHRSTLANTTVLQNAPCYDPTKDSTATAQECYNTMMRLAYLNQQSDSGSLILRAGNKCLTQTQLDAISNQDVADFHPLNCAKLNAKPYPYFDGGLIFMRKSGWFPYFSSRNNNFSNRQQIAVVCVGSSCTVDPNTGILQDSNPETNGNSVTRNTASVCVDSASANNGANANAAHSCLPAPTVTTNAAGAVTVVPTNMTNNILTTETKAVQEGDNDALGDGNPKGCAVLQMSASSSSVEQNVALAFILLGVGLFASWLGYYLYNRYQARKATDSKFRYDTAWQKASDSAFVEEKTRSISRASGIEVTASAPVASAASAGAKGSSAGVKLGRSLSPGTASGSGKKFSKGGNNYSKIEKTQMI